MTTRITGLYSGLDVDSLVEAGTSYEQNQVNQAKQQKQILQWKQEQYQDIETEVTDFYNKYLDITSDTNLVQSANWNTKKFTSSNDSAVSVTCSDQAVLNNYSVSVSQLASTAKSTIKDSQITGNKITLNYGVDSDGDGAISSSEKISIDVDLTGCTSDSDRAAAINKAISGNSSLKGKVTATASELSGGIILESADKGGNLNISVSSGGTEIGNDWGTYLNASITNSDGTTYAIDDSKKITNNSQTIDNVTFNFKGTTTSSSSSTGYLTSSSIQSLLGNNITKVDTSQSTYTTYTVNDPKTNNNYSIRVYQNGDITDGTGQQIDSTNGITLTNSDGTTTTIKGGSDNTASVTTTSKSDSQVAITGTTDVSDLQDTLESFFSDYNTLLEDIQGKYFEDYDRDYQPLTDDEKSSMTQDQITAWNKQAQTGLLKGDENLDQLSSDLKDSMSTFLKSAGINVESIGLTQADDYTTKDGTYTVDSDKLKAALEDQDTYNKIKDLFTNGCSTITSQTTKNSSTDGILAKMKVNLQNDVVRNNSIFSQAFGNDAFGSTTTTNELYQEIQDEDDEIQKWQDRLSDKQDSLYSKYSDLETKLSQLDSSSSLFGSSSSS